MSAGLEIASQLELVLDDGTRVDWKSRTLRLWHWRQTTLARSLRGLGEDRSKVIISSDLMLLVRFVRMDLL